MRLVNPSPGMMFEGAPGRSSDGDPLQQRPNPARSASRMSDRAPAVGTCGH